MESFLPHSKPRLLGHSSIYTHNFPNFLRSESLKGAFYRGKYLQNCEHHKSPRSDTRFSDVETVKLCL